MVHHHPNSGRLACQGCGTLYEVRKSRLAERNDGVIDCASCGTPFIEWTGPVDYHALVVTAAQTH